MLSGAWGDYNNDGYIDLYIGRLVGAAAARNALFRNNGNGTFTRVGARQAPSPRTRTIPWALRGLTSTTMVTCDMFVDNGWSTPPRNDLYWNNGDGTFRSGNAGNLTQLSKVRSWPAFADYDGDGWVDLYIAEGASWSDFTNLAFTTRRAGTFGSIDLVQHCPTSTMVAGETMTTTVIPTSSSAMLGPSVLWRNDGNGQFTAVNNGLPRTHVTSHAAWADYDRDGDLDIALCTSRGRASTEMTARTALSSDHDWPRQLVPAWADYDNDGYLDTVPVWQNTREAALYHNNGDGTFTPVSNVSTEAADYWLVCPWGDFDNDGFMDVILTHQYGEHRLYRNLGNTNHWIKFKLVGTASNRDAIGAKVRVQATIGGQSVWQMQEVNGGYTFQNDTRLNFGLGDATNVDLVRIEWPSGNLQELQNIAAGQIITITESRRPLLACRSLHRT